MPTYITVKDIAKRLHVSDDTVYGWINSGALKAYRLGAGPKAPIRVDVVDLAEFITPTEAVAV